MRLTQKEVQEKYFKGNRYSPIKSEGVRATYKASPHTNYNDAINKFNSLFKPRNYENNIIHA